MYYLWGVAILAVFWGGVAVGRWFWFVPQMRRALLYIAVWPDHDDREPGPSMANTARRALGITREQAMRELEKCN